MPTLRKRGDRWQIIIRLKGFPRHSEMAPDGFTKAQAKEVGLQIERDWKLTRAYSKTPTLQHELLKNWTLRKLIQDYIDRVEEANRDEHIGELASKLSLDDVNKFQVAAGQPALKTRPYKKPLGKYIYGKEVNRSWDNEKVFLDRFLREETALCDKTLDYVTTEDIQNYINKRLDEITPASLRRELNPIRTIWKLVGKHYKLPLKNIFADLEMPKQSDDPGRERTLKAYEYPSLLRAIEGCRGLKQQRLWTLFVIMALNTAMRSGELVKIIWRNFDPDERTLFIPGTITKSHKARKLPLTSDLCFKLSLYKNTISDAEKAPSARIFPIGDITKKYFKSARQTAWTRIVKRTTEYQYPLWIDNGHDDNVTIHSLRHTAITRFGSILTRWESEYMSGHKNPGVHGKYQHPDIDDIRRKLEAADDMFETATETITSLEDAAFFGRFNIDRMLESDPEGDFTPTPLPDVNWIKREGHVVMDMSGPKTKAYLERKVAQDLGDRDSQMREIERQVERQLNEARHAGLSEPQRIEQSEQASSPEAELEASERERYAKMDRHIESGRKYRKELNQQLQAIRDEPKRNKLNLRIISQDDKTT